MKKEVKIGLFAIVILVVSFFLINYLRGEDIFDNEIEIVGRFQDAEGLVASAPVHIKGFKAGKVSEVSYCPESGDFKVVCAVRKEFDIPSDSRMMIYAVDIMGGKGVRIDLGVSAEMVEDGDLIATGFEAGLLDELGGAAGPLLAKLGRLLDSLDVTVSGVNDVISEGNVKRIGQTLAHLENTIKNVENVSGTIDGRKEEIGALLDDLAGFSSELGGMAEKADSLLSGINDFVGTLNGSQTDSLLNSLHSLIDDINDPDGTVGKLLKEDSIYNSVDSLLIDINDLIEKISENPKKYLKISVF